MANKDFFDEEFEKLETEAAQKETKADLQTDNNGDGRSNRTSTPSDGGKFDSWSGYGAPTREQTTAKKPLYIMLICLALVLCIGLGSLLTVIFGGIAKSDQQALLDKVINILDNDFYEEVSDEKMWEAVEAAGTALLQTGGDRYSRLMSPKTFYRYMYGDTVEVPHPNGEFGMTFQFVEGVGMYILSVNKDSNSYGWLQDYDIIVKIDNINEGRGATVTVGGKQYSFTELVTSDCDEETFDLIFDATNSATFHALRNGEIQQYTIARRTVDYNNPDYPYDYVEFYFGDDCTNVSLTRQGTARYSTKEERHLDKLPSNTGYIRLSEFASLDKNPLAYNEFKAAMDLFKSKTDKNFQHLVLDLKGNPGGDVNVARLIAGLLITDHNLSSSDKSKVTSKTGELLVTSLNFRNGYNNYYEVESGYDNYFATPNGTKCDIVVWTDGGSASASELLTGTLLDYKTAVHMGTKTYGKGIAQVVMPLEGYKGTFEMNGVSITENWYIYYTAARYYPPLSSNIHEQGYTPSEEYNNLYDYESLWDATRSYFQTGLAA